MQSTSARWVGSPLSLHAAGGSCCGQPRRHCALRRLLSDLGGEAGSGVSGQGLLLNWGFAPEMGVGDERRATQHLDLCPPGLPVAQHQSANQLAWEEVG